MAFRKIWADSAYHREILWSWVVQGAKWVIEVVQRAGKGWVRVQANMSLGAYEVWDTTAPIPEPDWPDTPFKDLLRIAFRDRFITALDHPVLKRLRGEA